MAQAKQKRSGGLVLEKTITEIAEFFKETMQKLSISFEQLCDVVLQHEKRLQALEGRGDVRGELVALKHRVQALSDGGKREEGFEYLAHLCHILGVEDLEE